MEFLATLTTIGQLISGGVKLGLLASKRKQFQELETAFTKLGKQVNDEGERITRYMDFMKLIAEIDRALGAIRKSHDDIDDDQQFWGHIRVFHEDLTQLGVAQLREFSTDRLSERDNQKITAQRPRVSDQIVKVGEQYEQNRRLYLDHIRDGVAEIGYLKAIGATILQDIGANLRQFG